MPASAASGIAGSSGLRRPPMNDVSRTAPSGARPANMLLEKSVPSIERRSFFGTRKPNPASVVRDVGAPIRARGHGHRRVVDRGERIGRRRRQAGARARCAAPAPTASTTARVRRANAPPAASPATVYVPSSFRARLRTCAPQVTRGTPAGERIGERLHAVGEGKARRGVLRRFRVPLAFARAGDLALDQAAVFLFERKQPRKCRRHRDPLRVARVDAGDEGIDGVVEKLVAEAAAHERRDRFLDAGGRRRDERLAQEPQLRAKRECAGREEGRRRRRQRQQLAAAHDEARGRDRAGIAPLGGDAEVGEQRVDERRGVQRAVGPRFEQEAVAAAGCRSRRRHAAPASSTSTARPCCCSRKATVRPEMPPPITTTSTTASGSAGMRVASFIGCSSGNALRWNRSRRRRRVAAPSPDRGSGGRIAEQRIESEGERRQHEREGDPGHREGDGPEGEGCGECGAHAELSRSRDGKGEARASPLSEVNRRRLLRCPGAARSTAQRR